MRRPIAAAAPAPSACAEYACMLDEQPHYLVPAELVPAAPAGERAQWIVDPSLRIDGARVSVRDPMIGADAWFEIGAAFAAELARMTPGAAPPADLSARLASIAWAAGLVTTARVIEERTTGAARERARAAAAFAADAHVSVRGLVHPLHLGALRRHYRRSLRAGGLRPEPENPRRYIVHNDPVARGFHRQLADAVAAIAGAPVKPSYAYVVAYQGGASLPVHTDRAQCEYSISILIDFSPDTAGPSPWPLHLETDRGWTPLVQAIGDALVYRGRALAHYRDPLPVDMTSTSILFHYVDRDFDGVLD